MKFAKRLTLTFGVLALGIASAASSHHLRISDPTWVGGTELKPGDYRIEINGNMAVFTGNDKVKVEVPARVEQSQSKNNDTALISNDINGKSTLEEIRLGGSTTRIILQAPAGTQ